MNNMYFENILNKSNCGVKHIQYKRLYNATFKIIEKKQNNSI